MKQAASAKGAAGASRQAGAVGKGAVPRKRGDRAGGAEAGKDTGKDTGKVRGEPADFGGPDTETPSDQAACQGFDRQRLDPQDHPPADVLDDGNLAGEKDFEIGPGHG